MRRSTLRGENPRRGSASSKVLTASEVADSGLSWENTLDLHPLQLSRVAKLTSPHLGHFLADISVSFEGRLCDSGAGVRAYVKFVRDRSLVDLKGCERVD